MKLFNCIETIAIQVGKQISSNSFKSEATDKLISYISYILTDVKLLLSYSNTWNHLTVCKKNLVLFKNVLTNHIFNIYV